MALCAGRAGVLRHTVNLLVHVERDRIALGYADQIRITMAPEAVAVGGSGFIQDTSDGVWLVTIHADRYHIRPLTPQAALYHLAVHLLDLRVALLAGLTDVIAVNARCRIGVREDLVRRVTRRADRGDRQTLPEQTFAMYGERVVLEYAVLVDVVGP